MGHFRGSITRACTLSVYASQPGSPPDHATLDSGWWPALTGQGSHLLGRVEGFRHVYPSTWLSPSPSFAWRNKPLFFRCRPVSSLDRTTSQPLDGVLVVWKMVVKTSRGPFGLRLQFLAPATPSRVHTRRGAITRSGAMAPKTMEYELTGGRRGDETLPEQAPQRVEPSGDASLP